MDNTQLEAALREEFSPSWISLFDDGTIVLDGFFTLDDLKLLIRLIETKGKRNEVRP